MLRPVTHVGDLSDQSSITAMGQMKSYSGSGKRNQRKPIPPFLGPQMDGGGSSMALFGLGHIFFHLCDPLLFPRVEDAPVFVPPAKQQHIVFTNSNVFRWKHTGQ